MNDKYSDKPAKYFTNVRNDLISLLPVKSNLRILEVGAWGGDTLVKLKEQGKALEVTGIELMKIEGSNQASEIIDNFYFGNIETDSFPLPLNHYDAILCGDVLEHLLDPSKTVKYLSSLLSSGGILIISCPNIRHFSGFVQIYIKGTFPYSEEGLFDRTHFRFFCKKNLIELSQSGGLTLSKITPLFNIVGMGRSYLLNRLTMGIFEEFLSLQYVVVVKK